MSLVFAWALTCSHQVVGACGRSRVQADDSVSDLVLTWASIKSFRWALTCGLGVGLCAHVGCMWGQLGLARTWVTMWTLTWAGKTPRAQVHLGAHVC